MADRRSGEALLQAFDLGGLRGKRVYAMIPVLLGCGLRRAELAGLAVEELQQREEHWVITDLVGKGGHVRTVPVPLWVKKEIIRIAEIAAISAILCSARTLRARQLRRISLGQNQLTHWHCVAPVKSCSR